MFFFFRSTKFTQLQAKLDNVLLRAATYGLPVLITLASLAALVFWQSQYSTTGGATALQFRVLEDSTNGMAPTEALVKLGALTPMSQLETRLSQEPFWFSFDVAPRQAGGPVTVEFPSRHALALACWDAPSQRLLGRSNRQRSDGALAELKGGFALSLGELKGVQTVLCQARFLGPARLSLNLWPSAELQTSAQEFHRNSGLLDGGLIVLALFVLITALVNRQTTYLLFSVWLIINLRMGALSAGWDSQWLGQQIPQEFLPTVRLFTVALYYTVTISLFKTLFKNEILKIGYGYLWNIAQWSCIPLLLLSVFSPYHIFLPFVWVGTAYCIAIGVYFLLCILMRAPSSVAVLYSISIGITLFASLYEVIAAALGVRGLIGSVNSVTAALSSSLLASLAIAEQLRLEHKQWLETRDEMEHTFEALPIGLFTLDLQGQFLSANPALMKMLSPSVLEPGQNDWERYFSEGAWSKLHRLVLNQTDGELEIQGDGLARLAKRRFLVKATLARDKIEGSLQDVTEKSKAEDDLYFMANNDVLTKVLNRRGLERVYLAAMNKIEPGHPVALAYLDLDRFKLINDLYGHNVGDEVLQQVCRRVEKLLANDCQFGRVGGDEFVIVLPRVALPLARLICQGVIDSIGDEPFRVLDKAFYVRASMGLIEVSPQTDMKDAVSTADRACRAAKAGGGENLVVYEKGARAFQDRENELALVARLATPAASDAMFLVMQPIMSLAAPHGSLNFEVLLRMRDEAGALIPTETLIHAAESSGRMGMIDRWVLANTLTWLTANAAYLTTTKFICMNLSGASLNDEKFLQEAYELLAQTPEVSRLLCIEVTEGVALHDVDNTRKFIEKVRGFGAKVALDDFGAGYTSFSYLKNLTTDMLKIDGSFIVNMNQHPANIAIVEAIVNLAGNLGMKVIAEWAEDIATVQTLIEIGVDYVQGYVVARPQDPQALLTVRSSADFIQDPQFAQFISMIDRPMAVTPVADVLGPGKPGNVH